MVNKPSGASMCNLEIIILKEMTHDPNGKTLDQQTKAAQAYNYNHVQMRHFLGCVCY